MAGRKERDFIPWRKKREFHLQSRLWCSVRSQLGISWASLLIPSPGLSKATAQPGVFAPAPTGTDGVPVTPAPFRGLQSWCPAGTEMEHSLSSCAPLLRGARSIGSRACTKLFNILLSEGGFSPHAPPVIARGVLHEHNAS